MKYPVHRLVSNSNYGIFSFTIYIPHIPLQRGNLTQGFSPVENLTQFPLEGGRGVLSFKIRIAVI